MIILIPISLDARRTIREANTDPGTMGLNNLKNMTTTRDRERTLDIMFKQKVVISDDVKQSFPSTTTKIPVCPFPERWSITKYHLK
ncbi:hypothetical protein C0991_010125 [Blastosporella zonata]|nr:hypothetical protein C0991_010125 [Blastosporella zonata]